MTALTKALKDVVGKGTSFRLEQKTPNEIILFVNGGISDITIRLPFECLGEKHPAEFNWSSNSRTLEILNAAIEALPEEATPMIVLDTEEWDGGGLLLKGTWEKKGRGRSKGTEKQSRSLLFDAGIMT